MKNFITIVIVLPLLLAAGSYSCRAAEGSAKEPAFFGLGIGIGVLDWEFGRYGMSFNPKVQFKVGSSANRFNLVTGIRYRYNTGYNHFRGLVLGTVERDWQNKKMVYSSIASSQIQVPLQVRVNLSRRGTGPWFIGIGATADFNVDARIIDKVKGEVRPRRIVDRNMVNPFSCEADFHFGKKMRNFELYAYFRYDLMPLYRAGYIGTAYPDYATSVGGLVNNNWMVGIAGVVSFWKN